MQFQGTDYWCIVLPGRGCSTALGTQRRDGRMAASRDGLGLRIGLLVASALVLLGCPNPNTYTTPRTIGSGHFQHSLAAEAWGFSIPATSAYSTTEKLSGIVP